MTFLLAVGLPGVVWTSSSVFPLTLKEYEEEWPYIYRFHLDLAYNVVWMHHSSFLRECFALLCQLAGVHGWLQDVDERGLQFLFWAHR
uniref:Putative secreted protein n=1 Tax=Ixodes ricinus TaxID=34613 RepID=A0A6B0UFX8_IXORI